MVERIVSGGQTGVDRAALDLALQRGLPCGGWCPRGRRAEDGAVPDRYPLVEAPSRRYAERTRLNVRDSDATLVLTVGEPTGGTRQTVEECARAGKPYLVVDLAADPSPAEVAAWLAETAARVLNVAGPRESGRPGVYAAAGAFLARVLGPA